FVMPAHDVAAFVATTVASALAQTWPAVELVAIDDGSTDGTDAILERLARDWTGPGRVMTIHRQAQAGAAAARNAGLALARGRFVCFLDADDRLAPTLLARLVAALRADPDFVLAAPLWRYIDVDGTPTGIVSTPNGLRHDARDLVVRGPLHSATGVMVHAEAASAAGPFDIALSGYIDLDWFARLLAVTEGRAVIVPEPLADYRKRPGQITSSWRRMEGNWSRLLDKMTADGRGLSPSETRRARARNLMFWATLAFQEEDYPAVRRLVLESWSLDGRAALRDRNARMRTMAAVATLLPRPVQDLLRRRVTAISNRV
ncbi:MAG: glycosyltransferase family A protein, partial [Pseudomonadota bacterium]